MDLPPRWSQLLACGNSLKSSDRCSWHWCSRLPFTQYGASPTAAGGRLGVGIILSLLAVYGIVAGLFAILVVAGIQFATLLQDYAPQFQAFLQQAAQLLESVGVSQQKLQDLANELSPSRLVGVAGSLLGGLAGVLSDIFFLIVLLFSQ